MNKVLIVGAGAQGGPCTSILSRDESIEEIRLADIDLNQAEAVQKKIGSPKVKAMQLDAGNLEAVTKAAEGMDAIINLTVECFNEIIIKAAVKNRIHYVDTGNSAETLERYAKGQRVFDLEEDFESFGKTALLGCGGSPGLVNVIVRYVCDQMEEVEKICIRIGTKNIAKEGDDVVKGWNPGWSPVTALEGFAEQPCVYEDGEYKRLPIFSRPEEYPFPESFGKCLITSHLHDEVYTLPLNIKKGVQEVDFKYPVDPIAGALVKMGFADEKEIEVRGTKILPREVLLNMLPPMGDAFLGESEETAGEDSGARGMLEVTVDGVMNGRKVAYKAWMGDSEFNPDENQYLYETFGTTQIMIPLPAAVGAKMCMNGMTDAGMISSECLNPEQFFKIMGDMGVPMEISEQIISEKSFA